MVSNTILDEAEQRIPSVADQARTGREEAIESMRDEIGRNHYGEAKRQLPLLDTAVAEIYRPFINRLAGLESRSKTPLPVSVRAWLTEMGTISESVPRTIREGLSDWDAIEPPIWKVDGKSIDQTVRAATIHGVRTRLRNWDGVRSRLAFLQGQVEQYVRESCWPTRG